MLFHLTYEMVWSIVCVMKNTPTKESEKYAEEITYKRECIQAKR